MRAACVGGPADGLMIPLAGGERWVDPIKARGHAKRAAGRALYLRRGRGALARWMFAGHNAGHCQGCGVRIAPADKGFPVTRCELCGRAEPVLTT